MLDAVQRHRARLWQLGRYLITSVVANLTTITVLGILVGLLDFDAGWSNVIATAVATIPAFELNRRWVWSKDGKASVGAEVLPFWLWAFFELAVSSLAVHLMGLHATHAGWHRGVRTVVLEITSIGTTGILWAAQFVLFDRVLFRRRRTGSSVAVPDQRPRQGVSTISRG